MNWSDEQNLIFDHVVHLFDHPARPLVVKADAGTGKTTTMIEAIARFCARHARRSVMMTAFNKRNATELSMQLSARGLEFKQARGATLHSMGYSACRYHLRNPKVDDRKGRDIAKALCGDRKSENVRAVQRLASIAKGMLVHWTDLATMARMVVEFDILVDDVDPIVIAKLGAQAMKAAFEDTSTVDFDDMIWFPHVHDLSPYAHDVVVVDEAQDMNAAQLAIARSAVKQGGRLIAIGDPKQAIYGWRGADSGFMDRLIRESEAAVLTLTTTYRCGHAIVAEAKRYAPNYKAHESNPQGEVRTGEWTEAEPGDFLLSRTNAPLMPKCLAFIKMGKAAYIQGRDVGRSLIALVKLAERKHARTSEELEGWMDAWHQKQTEALVAAEASDSAFDVVNDKRAIIKTLCGEYDTTERIKLALGELFDDDRPEATSICLSTVHRAKGLERDRVFLLMDTFRFDGGQEDNIMYVAISRAKTELVRCYDD